MDNEVRIAYYVYKITFLCGSLAGHYYIGKRTSKLPGYSKPYSIMQFVLMNPSFDNYCGSGTIVINYFKKYKKKLGETYLKEILCFSGSSDSNCKHEYILIGDKYKTDPLCVNLTSGGKLNPALHGIKFIRHCTEAQRQQNSECHKKLWEDPEYRNRVLESIMLRHKLCGTEEYLRRVEAKHDIMPEDQKKQLSDRFKGTPNLKNRGCNNGMFGKIPANAKRVLQLSKEGDFIKEWASVAEAQRSLNICNIAVVCQGKRSLAGGYKWEYSSNQNIFNFSAVEQYDLSDNFIKVYKSAWEAAKELNIDSKSIWEACKRDRGICKGFIWRFKNNQ